MKPIATCPICGNDKDGTIQITATATATVENGHSLLYEDYNVSLHSETRCMECNHVNNFAEFEVGVLPFTQIELDETISFLRKVSDEFSHLRGERIANRCIGVLRFFSKTIAVEDLEQTSAPAVAGE
jgi:hypothetical protein